MIKEIALMRTRLLLLLSPVFLISSASAQTTLISLTFSQPPRFNVDAGSYKTINAGEQLLLGSDVKISGGTPSFRYSWQSDMGVISTTATAEVNATGTYYLTVEDARHCTATDSVQVGITGISEYKKETSAFIVFPNPSDGQINIDFKKIQHPVDLQIYSSNGKLIFSMSVGKITGNILPNLKLPDTDPGIYFIRVTDESAVVSTSSIMINEGAKK